MFKTRAVLLGLLALLITSGFVTSVASAANPAWKVNGSKLGAQVKQQLKITAGETELKSTITMLPVTITCHTAVVNNAYIEGNGTGAGQGGAAGITFSNNCTQEGLGNSCSVKQPIQTKQLKAHLVTYGPQQGKIGVLFEPSQAQEFAVIEFTNKEGELKCPVTGQVFPVKGSVVAELRAIGQDQKQEPLESSVGELILPKAQPITSVKLEGQARTAGLMLGAEKATFAGKFAAQLISLNQKPDTFGVFYG
jgi:hypothetical protein